jgi:hypothetical protein
MTHNTIRKSLSLGSFVALAALTVPTPSFAGSSLSESPPQPLGYFKECCPSSGDCDGTFCMDGGATLKCLPEDEAACKRCHGTCTSQKCHEDCKATRQCSGKADMVCDKW